MTTARMRQHRVAMRTAIDERAQAITFVPHNDVHAQHVGREKVTSSWHVVDGPDGMPGTPEEAMYFQVVLRLLGIETRTEQVGQAFPVNPIALTGPRALIRQPTIISVGYPLWNRALNCIPAFIRRCHIDIPQSVR
jgi:hypothetical protein